MHTQQNDFNDCDGEDIILSLLDYLKGPSPKEEFIGYIYHFEINKQCLKGGENFRDNADAYNMASNNKAANQNSFSVGPYHPLNHFQKKVVPLNTSPMPLEVKTVGSCVQVEKCCFLDIYDTIFANIFNQDSPLHVLFRSVLKIAGVEEPNKFGEKIPKKKKKRAKQKATKVSWVPHCECVPKFCFYWIHASLKTSELFEKRSRHAILITSKL